MTLRWIKKSTNRIDNRKADITFIENYKQRPNKSITKTPTRIVLNKKSVLLGICRKRQQFTELRTIRAVENCRRLVSEQIESFFEQKERTVNNLPEIIVGRKSYSNVFNNNDVEKLYDETERIILNNLFQRFNCLIARRQIKTNSDFRFSNQWISDIFSPLQKYIETKNQTVLITSLVEALSRRTLSDSIESLVANSIIAKLVCNIDISTILLPKLGISSGLETMELNEELLKRISGALYSIKVHLIQEINSRIAHIFYEIHDSHLESALELKIHRLEEKIAVEIYQTELPLVAVKPLASAMGI